MKTQLLWVGMVFFAISVSGQIAINTDGSMPDNSAMLDIKSTSKGVLFPRMTNAQKNTINDPVEGLVIYNLEDDCLEFYVGYGWYNICTQLITTPAQYTLTGAPIVTGLYEYDVSLSPAEIIEIEVDVTETGYWGVVSDEINGISFSGSGVFTATGAQTIQITGSGTPAGYGSFQYQLNFSNMATANTQISVVCASYLSPENTEVVEITGAAGRIWMDRNLGAHRAATSPGDCRAYGHHYQWGRGNDEHQQLTWNNSTSATITNGHTNTLSNMDQPGHNKYIVPPGNPYDWRSPQNNDLWNTGINDPCPAGFRLPTNEEWEAEVAAAGISNGFEAFNSTLKLTFTGYRNMYSYANGRVSGAGLQGDGEGNYWSSTPGTTHPERAKNFWFWQSGISHGEPARAYGLSVRCIKEE